MFGKTNKGNRKNNEIAKAVVADTPSEDCENDASIIAVISAAIAAYLGTSSNGIIIRSLKRSRISTPAWGLEGRNAQIYHQF